MCIYIEYRPSFRRDCASKGRNFLITARLEKSLSYHKIEFSLSNNWRPKHLTESASHRAFPFIIAFWCFLFFFAFHFACFQFICSRLCSLCFEGIAFVSVSPFFKLFPFCLVNLAKQLVFHLFLMWSAELSNRVKMNCYKFLRIKKNWNLDFSEKNLLFE